MDASSVGRGAPHVDGILLRYQECKAFAGVRVGFPEPESTEALLEVVEVLETVEAVEPLVLRIILTFRAISIPARLCADSVQGHQDDLGLVF